MVRTAPDVFTADEVARAAGVSRRLVVERMAKAGIRPIADTRYIRGSDALRLTRDLQRPAQTLPSASPAPWFRTVSFGMHAVVVALVLVATAGAPETASPVPVPDEARMVFLVTPGPGGGGGGGGLRQPKPAPRVERRGTNRAISVPQVAPAPPKPAETAPEPPLPSRTIVAPVAQMAADTREREGVIEHPAPTEIDSHGSGAGGGAGTGQGTGNGEGLGSGIGDGSGGGTGGGPYRPGSGIEPPRLLREVKADYTEDARRRGITGDVELEIVVRRDGSVGEVTVLKGLGAGLDQRAVAAVRQWRFSPARRKGEPVDVIVEVAVEFTLR